MRKLLRTTAAWLLVAGSLLVAPAVADPLPVPPGLIQGTKWGASTLGTGATVTYSYDTAQAGETSLSSFMPAGYQSEIASALATWSDVADIHFVEVPSGGDLRFVGGSIDGPGSVAANATYPGSSYNRVRFDTDNSWYLNPDGTNNIRELAMHEIGHAIGLLHPPGIIARMDHRVSNAYEGLLPPDVAGIQAIYGPAAGSNPDDYAVVDASTFNVLPSSSINIRIHLASLIDVTESSDLSGTLDARLAFAPDGTPNGVTLYGGDMAFSDVLLSVANSLLSADVNFSDVLGLVMNTDWFGPGGHLTSVVGGEFSTMETILGLVGGEAAYDVQSTVLGISQSGVFNFDHVNTAGAGPQAFGVVDDGRLGQLTRNGSIIDLTYPVSTTSELPIPTGSGEIPITIEVTGTIYAQLVVPEPSSIVLAAFAALACLVVTSACASSTASSQSMAEHPGGGRERDG